MSSINKEHWMLDTVVRQLIVSIFGFLRKKRKCPSSAQYVLTYKFFSEWDIGTLFGFFMKEQSAYVSELVMNKKKKLFWSVNIKFKRNNGVKRIKFSEIYVAIQRSQSAQIYAQIFPNETKFSIRNSVLIGCLIGFSYISRNHCISIHKSNQIQNKENWSNFP